MPNWNSLLKKIVIALVILTGIIAVLYISANYFIEERLPKLLGDQVTLEETKIDLFQRNIRFINPVISIDSAFHKSGMSIRSSAKEIGINGFGIWDLLIGNKIEVDKLYLDSVVFEVVLPTSIATKQDKSEINLFIKNLFTKIKVEYFELKNGHFIVAKDNGKTKSLEVYGFNLTAEQVLIDTSTVTHVFPMEFKKSSLSFDSIYGLLGEEYTLTAHNLSIADTTLSLQNLQIHSIYSKQQFVKAHKYERARLDLEVKEIVLHHLLWDIQQDSTISISMSKMACEELRLSVFKDKTPAIEPPTIKPLLVGLIKQLPFLLTVDTITWRKSYIGYEQLPVVFPRSGVIFFDNLYVTGYHLSNDSSNIARHPTATLDVISQFMGKGKLAITIKLEMDAPAQNFSVKGSLGAMPVTYINKVLAPLTGVEAEGEVEKMDFTFSGDEYAASGKLIFEYDNLKITSYDQKRKKQWLKSLVGNLILNNKNKSDQGLTYKEGEIYFVRYQNKDFFNYLWNSLRTGLMEIVVPFYKNPDKGRDPDAPTKFQEDN